MNLPITEISSVFGTIQLNNGQRDINSIIVNRVWTKTLYAENTMTADTIIATTLNVATMNINSLALGDGSVSSPSLKFTSNPTTGVYKTALGMGFTLAGTLAMEVASSGVRFTAPISSQPATNLTINSSTSVVDFSGNTLINVGGISTNPNRYEVISPGTVITTDATPTILYNIPTVTDATYIFNSDITCADDVGNMDSAGFIVSAKGKNLAGTVSVSVNLENNSAIDSALAGISVIYSVSGTNITLLATGKVGKTIKWFGATTVTRQLF